MAAKREDIADKLDRHQITEPEANLEMAQTYSGLTSVANARQVASTQIALQAAVEAANRPAPAPNVTCTSQRFLNTVQTNCN